MNLRISFVTVLVGCVIAGPVWSAPSDTQSGPRPGWTFVLVREQSPEVTSRVRTHLSALPDRLRRHCAANAEADFVPVALNRPADTSRWRRRVCLIVAGHRMASVDEFARLRRLRDRASGWRAGREGRKLEILVFNMCAMGRIEVGYLFRDEAHHLLAPERRLPSRGLDFSPLREVRDADDGAALGRRLLRATQRRYRGRPGAEPALALCRLDAAECLARAIRQFARSGALPREDIFDLHRPLPGSAYDVDLALLFEEIARQNVAGRRDAASAVLQALLPGDDRAYIVAHSRTRGMRDAGVAVTFPAEAVLRETAGAADPKAAALLDARGKAEFARHTAWPDVFAVPRKTLADKRTETPSKGRRTQ